MLSKELKAFKQNWHDKGYNDYMEGIQSIAHQAGFKDLPSELASIASKEWRNGWNSGLEDVFKEMNWDLSEA